MMNRYHITPIPKVEMKPEAYLPGAVVHPTQTDIILGRGVLHASHPGNKRFYAIIDKYMPLYDAAESRADKTKVVQTIYETITSKARFVKDDAESSACIVIETKKAKKKISHAIRFRRQAGKSSAADARRAKTAMPSPGSQLLRRGTKIQEFQAKLQLQQDSLKGLFQEQLVAATDTPRRVSTMSQDCIIPDEDLESVLLLPEEEMETKFYGDLLWSDLSEDKVPDTRTSVDFSANMTSEYSKGFEQPFEFQPHNYGIPALLRPLALSPDFVSKTRSKSLCSMEPVPPPSQFPEDSLDLSTHDLFKFFGDDELLSIPSSFGEDVLPLPLHFPHLPFFD